ncbi:uncharacterized protein METZ01_LOCUS190007, partial [marine metagenome]
MRGIKGCYGLGVVVGVLTGSAVFTVPAAAQNGSVTYAR